MKNQFCFLVILLLGIFNQGIAQVPASMKYQAAARHADGTVMKNQLVSFRISLHQESIDGLVVFSETHNVSTNDFGIAHLNIGEGTPITGALNNLDWGVFDHFIEVEIDPEGGTDFIEMGTTQLLTVPYAFFADNGVQFNQDLMCDASTEGTIRYNYDSKTIEVCNGEEWVELGSGGSSGFNCGDPLVDSRDGQSYATIKIGDQCWMAENLNYGTFKESIATDEFHTDVSNNGIVEKYAYDNDEAQLELTGGLYDWNEMMNYNATESSQGICPDGWHVPSYDEFVELVETAGDWLQAGKALKTGGSTGFEFPMGGNRREKGVFTGGGTSGSMWTSSISLADPDTRAWNIYFIDDSDHAAKATELMLVGKSCRCVKD
jgi:uncharacterized protein (TIGR02145 family)